MRGAEISLGKALDVLWLLSQDLGLFYVVTFWELECRVEPTASVSPNFSNNLILHWNPLYPALRNPTSIPSSCLRTIRFLAAASARKKAGVDHILFLSFHIINNKPIASGCFITHCALQTSPAPRQRPWHICERSPVSRMKVVLLLEMLKWFDFLMMPSKWQSRANFSSILMLFCMLMRNVNIDWLFLPEKAATHGALSWC